MGVKLEVMATSRIIYLSILMVLQSLAIDVQASIVDPDWEHRLVQDWTAHIENSSGSSSCIDKKEKKQWRKEKQEWVKLWRLVEYTGWMRWLSNQNKRFLKDPSLLEIQNQYKNNREISTEIFIRLWEQCVNSGRQVSLKGLAQRLNVFVPLLEPNLSAEIVYRYSKGCVKKMISRCNKTLLVMLGRLPKESYQYYYKKLTASEKSQILEMVENYARSNSTEISQMDSYYLREVAHYIVSGQYTASGIIERINALGRIELLDEIDEQEMALGIVLSYEEAATLLNAAIQLSKLGENDRAAAFLRILLQWEIKIEGSGLALRTPTETRGKGLPPYPNWVSLIYAETRLGMLAQQQGIVYESQYRKILELTRGHYSIAEWEDIYWEDIRGIVQERNQDKKRSG